MYVNSFIITNGKIDSLATVTRLVRDSQGNVIASYNTLFIDFQVIDLINAMQNAFRRNGRLMRRSYIIQYICEHEIGHGNTLCVLQDIDTYNHANRGSQIVVEEFLSDADRLLQRGTRGRNYQAWYRLGVEFEFLAGDYQNIHTTDDTSDLLELEQLNKLAMDLAFDAVFGTRNHDQLFELYKLLTADQRALITSIAEYFNQDGEWVDGPYARFLRGMVAQGTNDYYIWLNQILVQVTNWAKLHLARGGIT